MSALRLAGGLAIAVLFLAACKTVTPAFDQEVAGSDVQFKAANWNINQCILKYAHAPKIKVCISGNGNKSVGQAKVREALLKWLAPLQAKYENIASDVEFTCAAPHAKVNLHAGHIGATGGPGFINAGDGNPIGTYLHEFGHAFACLADTYVGGAAGHCQQGQPKSIMCHGLLLSDITADDVNGLMHQYSRMGFTAAQLDPAGDEDADGIANGLDKCPGSPAGVNVWGDEDGGKWRGCAGGQTPILL